MIHKSAQKLDLREQHYWIDSPRQGMQLFLRYLPAPAGLFAGRHPAMVDRMVLFGAIARRPPRRYEKPPTAPAWRIVTVEDQWARFVEDVPRHERPVLSRANFDEWSERYLDSDPDSRTRELAGVKTPTGPFTDILHAWHGNLAYDPGLVQAPVAIIRGEWD